MKRTRHSRTSFVGPAALLIAVAGQIAGLVITAPTTAFAADADTMTIKRHYAYAGERRVHYRRAGEGAPLVLLHASPGSSAGLVSLIEDLAEHYTVIAIDSPGYGESTMRFADVLEIARHLKNFGAKVRLNTNGHASLIEGRDVIPELAGLIDSVSVSLNHHTREGYASLCRPQFGEETYDAMIDFIMKAREMIPEVVVTAIEGLPEVDTDACRKKADELGVEFRMRYYVG